MQCVGHHDQAHAIFLKTCW